VAVPGTDVVINSEKPRKGCFEIKANGAVVLSLLDMPRPFTKLKASVCASRVAPALERAASPSLAPADTPRVHQALDMEELAEKVAAALK